MAKKLYNEPSPLETKVISKRWGLENSESLDTYLANDGFVAFRKARQMTPEAIIEEVKLSALRGRNRARTAWNTCPMPSGTRSTTASSSSFTEDIDLVLEAQVFDECLPLLLHVHATPHGTALLL